MNSFLFYTGFFTLSSAAFALALNLKAKCKGNNFSKKLFISAIFYNLACSAIHWRFSESGNFAYIADFDNSIMGFASLLFAFAHGYAMPYKKQ